jgi:PAS domain S-box-containing protein
VTREVFHAIVESTTDAIAVIDAEGRITYANPAALRLLGARIATFRGGSVADLVHPDDRAGLSTALEEALSRPGPRPQRELRIIADDGDWLPIELRAVNLLDDPAVRGLLVTVRPVSERVHLTRALRTLGEGNLVLVSAQDEEALLQRMCETVVQTGGYLLAWVGLREHDPERSVTPVAAAGDVDYLEHIQVSWGDGPTGQGPTGRSIRSGAIQVVDDFRKDAAFSPWREAALSRGFRTSCVLPLRHHGEVVGTLNIYAGEPGAFGPDSIALLEKLSSALSYGLERLRDGARLARSLDATLGALASLTEKRDPYTAGHMCRVGMLTSAIGESMGLGEQELRGMRIAADLHDVGKIVIPSEILTRPTRLSPEEYALVKLHSRAGHEVLAGIDFPWPVGTMVVQHHERLDGSGYPDGLKGDQILLGSRVIAVADTVEAMTNHRPYRPSLGLETALETIQAGAGTLYDPDVVEACMRMFEQGGFHFDHAGPDHWVAELRPGAPGGR